MARLAVNMTSSSSADTKHTHTKTHRQTDRQTDGETILMWTAPWNSCPFTACMSHMIAHASMAFSYSLCLAYGTCSLKQTSLTSDYLTSSLRANIQGSHYLVFLKHTTVKHEITRVIKQLAIRLVMSRYLSNDRNEISTLKITGHQ